MQVVIRARAVVTPRIATEQRAPASAWTTLGVTTASFVRMASMETLSNNKLLALAATLPLPYSVLA